MGTRDQLRAAANARLERFATEWFLLPASRRRPASRLPAIFRTLDAGDDCVRRPRRCSAGVQHELTGLESPVEAIVAKRLVRERFNAITALIYLDGPKGAKETLLRRTDGAPLTICMGDFCRIRTGQRDGVKTRVGFISFAVEGCRAIFEEDRRTSGEMWAGLCPDCRRKKPRRDQGRALKRRIDDLRRGRGATAYEWSVTISPDADNGAD